MDLEKIGKFISEQRKELGLTQEQLGEKLGVTNKTVSRWETGTYMPPADVLLSMSELFGVTINEILSGRNLSDDEYKQAAEENLTQTIKSSAFDLKDRIEFFKKKWKKDNRFGLTLGMIVILVIIVLGFFYGAEFTLIGAIAGFAFAIYEHNRMMIYIENHAYDGTGK